MTGGLGWAPFFPWPPIAGLGMVSLALLGLAARRGGGGVLCRAAVICVLALVLLNPRLVREERTSRPDVAVVIVDQSKSQTVGARKAESEAALEHIREALSAFTDLELRVVRVGGGGTDAADGKEAGSGTRIFSALARTLTKISARRFAAAILITDGQIHDVPSDPALERLNGPVHALLSGAPGEKDRRLVVTRAPGYGIVGKKAAILYRVVDAGQAAVPGFGGKTARVRFRRDGVEAASALVPVGKNGRFSFVLEHAGPTVVELEVELGEDELSALNNRAAVTINAVRDRLRVLLVSGQPHAGERTWRNLLKSDPSVDLAHFTILRPPEKDDFTPLNELSLISFPVRELFEVKLKDFDLIIFDRYMLRNVLPLSYLDNIANYLRQGGAMLLAVGPEFAGPRSLYHTSLGAVMPAAPTGRVFEGSFRPRLTELGGRHPVTAVLGRGGGDRRQWGRWFRQIDASVAGGMVLLRGPGERPLLVVDRVGKGRVGQLLSDHIWLWARRFEGGGPQAELLRRLAHWLMKEPDLEEESLTIRIKEGRLAIERHSLVVEPKKVTVTFPSGRQRKVELAAGKGGLAGASMPAAESGLYRVEDGKRTALAAAGVLNPLETADLRATPERLSGVAKATGGGIAWIADGIPDFRRTMAGRDTAGRGWMGLKRNASYLVTGVAEVSLLPGLLVLALVLGGLMVAWWREGR